MKKIILEDIEYEIIKNYKDAYVLEELSEKYTDYFEIYDYILGDYSYGKLRLKGFCDKSNKNFNDVNDFSKIDEYLKEFCSHECGYFILKKISKSR